MKELFLKLLLMLNAKLPLRASHAIGAFLGRRLIKGNSRQKRNTYVNIQLCFPELTPTEQLALINNSLIETCKTLTESGLMWMGSPQRFERLVKEVHGEEHVKHALKNGKGVILAIPHLGNWEAVGIYCSARYPMTSLYRPPKLAALDKTIRHARERLGAKLVPTNAQGVKALYTALKNNELVAILPDQDPRASGGHFAPFFGHQANTMTLLSRLAQKSNAAVICTYVARLPNSQGFAIHFTPIEEGIYSKDLDVSLTTLNQAVEASIRHIPEQYQWSYKRFNQRPDGETDLYS